MRKILVVLLIALFASCAELLNPLIGSVWYAEDESWDWIYFENFGCIDSAFWSNSTIDIYYTKNNGKRATYVFYLLE